MNIILIFLAGVVVGVAGVLIWQWVVAERKKETVTQRQKREKEEDKARILGIFEIDPQLTNEKVEQYFGIPESTATRYLDELEKEGKVRQVGETGRDVYYERI